MADPFARVEPGDEFRPTAATVNGWNEAARIVLSNRLNTGGGPLRSSLLPGQVYVQNNSSADRDVHDCLAIDPGNIVFAPNGEPDDHVPYSFPVLFGITPGPDFTHFGKFVVCAEPIRAGDLGRAWIAGVFWARIKGKGSHCDLTGNENRWLRAGPFGHARILWAVDGHYASSAERLAVIRMADPQLAFIGTAQAEVGKYLTGSVVATLGPTPGGSATDPEIVVPDVYNPGPIVTEGYRSEVKWINDHWEFGYVDCPPEEESP